MITASDLARKNVAHVSTTVSQIRKIFTALAPGYPGRLETLDLFVTELSDDPRACTIKLLGV